MIFGKLEIISLQKSHYVANKTHTPNGHKCAQLIWAKRFIRECGKMRGKEVIPTADGWLALFDKPTWAMRSHLPSTNLRARPRAPRRWCAAGGATRPREGAGRAQGRGPTTSQGTRRWVLKKEGSPNYFFCTKTSPRANMWLCANSCCGNDCFPRGVKGRILRSSLVLGLGSQSHVVSVISPHHKSFPSVYLAVIVGHALL